MVRQQREQLVKLWQQSKGAAKENFEKAKEGTGELVHKGLQTVEQGTGLRVGTGLTGEARTKTSSQEPKKLV